MSNGDVWRALDGQVVTEVKRTLIGSRWLITVVDGYSGRPTSPWAQHKMRDIPLAELTPEPARYEGARGGRA